MQNAHSIWVLATLWLRLLYLKVQPYICEIPQYTVVAVIVVICSYNTVSIIRYIMSNDRMRDEMDRISKEAVMKLLRHYTSIYLEGVLKIIKT